MHAAGGRPHDAPDAQGAAGLRPPHPAGGYHCRHRHRLLLRPERYAVKYAKFAVLDSEVGCQIVLERADGDEDRTLTGYVRLTEWVTIDFPPRASEEVVPEQLAVLDLAEKELRLKFETKLHELAEQRAKLLCLTHEVAA